MTSLPIAAGVGIEGIIWIIILIFWSIAQYVQKSRAAQRRPPLRPGSPRPTPPARPPTQMENELQDLLRELTGQGPVLQDEDDEPAPVNIPSAPPPLVRRTAPPPPPPPVAKPHQTLASARRAEAAAPAPRKPRSDRTRPEPQEPIRPEFVAAVGDLSEGMGAAFVHSGKMPGMTLKMKSVSLRGISFSGSSSPGRGGNSAIKLSSLRHPATLRQMVIGRAILDKPKALETGSGF